MLNKSRELAGHLLHQRLVDGCDFALANLLLFLKAAPRQRARDHLDKHEEQRPQVINATKLAVPVGLNAGVAVGAPKPSVLARRADLSVGAAEAAREAKVDQITNFAADGAEADDEVRRFDVSVR